MSDSRLVLILVAIALGAAPARGHGGFVPAGGTPGGPPPTYTGPVGGVVGPTGGGGGGGAGEGAPGGAEPGRRPRGEPVPPAGPPVRPGAGGAVNRGGAAGRGGATGGKKGAGNAGVLDWRRWWWLNADRHLLLRSRVRKEAARTANTDTFLDVETPGDDVAGITARSIRKDVLPALFAAAKDPHFDTRASAVIALGKVADLSVPEAAARLTALLCDDDKIVRESACLGLGLLGDRSAAQDLLDIARGTARGRELARAGGGEIPARMRCFAAVALGLIGARAGYGPADSVVPALIDLAKSPAAHADLQVGPVVALQLFRAPEAVPALLAMFQDPALSPLLRAHAAVALGKAGSRAASPALLAGLEDRAAVVQQASAVALGLVVAREDREAVDRLLRFARNAPDRDTRSLCLIALGEIGDPRGNALLVEKVRKGQYADATFAALALGVLGRRFEEERAAAGEVLLEAYRESKDLEKAAIGIGLGLLDHAPARDAIRADVAGGAGSGELRGHLCTALGLLGDREAIVAIRELVKQRGDPELRQRAAIALGLLEDPQAVRILAEIIQEPSATTETLGAATTALGHIGDRSAVPILCGLVRSRPDEHQDMTRAFATVALGFLGDKDDVPLFARLHADSACTALTEGLVELLSIL